MGGEKIMQIFLSYASIDFSEIQDLFRYNPNLRWDYLEHSVIYNFNKSIWQLRVKRKIKNCDYVLYALSSNTDNNNNTHWELDEARKLGKMIYVIKLDDLDTIPIPDDTYLIKNKKNIEDEIKKHEKQKLKDELFQGFNSPKSIIHSNREMFFQEYKLIVETSENLVKRRQVVNTFFLTLHLALLSYFGVIMKNVQSPFTLTISYLLLFFVLFIIGAISSWPWEKMIHSYGQLNTGKFAVINIMEEFLPAMIFQTEWLALGKGRDKKRYSSFTQIEQDIPKWLLRIYISLLAIDAVYLCQQCHVFCK